MRQLLNVGSVLGGIAMAGLLALLALVYAGCATQSALDEGVDADLQHRNCGNGTCDGNENASSCPQDCAASCGDGTCDATESCSSCAADCGACTGTSADMGPGGTTGGTTGAGSVPALVGCPTSGYKRLVNVSTASELAAAFSSALAGDQIRLAAGTYLGPTKLAKSGTATDPIVICGVAGTWPVLHGGTFQLNGSYVTATGLVFEGPDNSTDLIYVYSTDHVTFTGNEVRNSDWHAGFSLDDNSNLTITRNYIHDNGLTEIDHGIYCRQQAGPVLISNNVIFNNHGRGISMHDNAGDPISDITVVNNTIVRNGSTGILVSVNAGTGDVVANNVLYDNGWIYDYKQIRSHTGTGNLITHNVAYSPDPNHNGIALDVTTNDVVDNLAVDPLFVSLYSDLHLQAGSPAIGFALSQYSPSVDFDGKARDAAPDSGAYEY